MDKIMMEDKEIKMIQQNKGTIITFNKLILPQQDELLFNSTKSKDWAFNHAIMTYTTKDNLFLQTCTSNKDTGVI